MRGKGEIDEEVNDKLPVWLMTNPSPRDVAGVSQLSPAAQPADTCFVRMTKHV